jgi:hypothetical protein
MTSLLNSDPCLCVWACVQFPEEAAIPKVFPLASRKPAGASAIVTRQQFARNFNDIFTEGLLKCTHSSNCCTALAI